MLTGPTGVGKTGLSREIAARLPVEIISADSRQIYRYMDIGTAKASAELRKAIPHHFIDILNPDQDYSAGMFGKEARRCIGEIFRRGNIPLVVGGSGLYIRALLYGFFREDARDLTLREQIKNRLSDIGPQGLHEELGRVDPLAAQKIHPNNTRRVIRALEVSYATGRPITDVQVRNPDPAPFKWLQLGLTMEREALYERINDRVEVMFEAGLIEEVRGILMRGYSREHNALNSVGYKEVIEHFDGDMALDSCKDLIKRNTRRYAKRQLTWFRADENIQWVDKHSPDAVSSALQLILDQCMLQNS